MEMNQYLPLFIDESREHLQAINDNLLSLENNPGNVEFVHPIFRSAHTLKGMSATMGFEDIASLTHEMENVLDRVRNLKLKMDPFIFDCIFKSLDLLEKMVEHIVQTGATGQPDVTGIIAALKSIVSGDYLTGNGNGMPAPSVSTAGGSSSVSVLDEYQQSILQQVLEAGMNVFRIGVQLQDNCVLKGARAYMVFHVLEENGEVIIANPSAQDIEQERFDRSFTVYTVMQIAKEKLEDKLSRLSDIERIEITALTQEKLQALINPPVSVSVEAPGAAELISGKAAATDGLKAAAPKKPSAQGNAPAVNRTIRVDIERIDTLINLFSELLIERSRLGQLAGEVKRNDLTEAVEHLSRVSSDLQNLVLNLRMVEVDTVFNRFPRMIRDVAKSLDKKVELVITGADTELDRTVVDEVGDPLVHLLRNAVDHGLEPTADRVAAGKPETGTIYLRAYHSGNDVCIEVEEDGRGINRDKIVGKAIHNGIVTQEDAVRMTDEEVGMLIFASGFSTADQVSDLSGRGVGLDVVKTKIESLGGSVQVMSKLGYGSKFSIRLPLTLSIIAAMLVNIGTETYAIPLSSIVETAAVRKEQLRTVHGKPMMDYKDGVIPFLPLAQLFGVPGCSDPFSGEMQIVVIRSGDKLAALIVNEIIWQQDIVLKPLGAYLTPLFAISGATILGDGKVALIIDANSLIK